MTQFIQIHHRMVNLDAIAYVDFLESGRAMVYMRGLSQEKQNITVDPDEARLLRAFFDAQTPSVHAGPVPLPLPLPGMSMLRR